MGIEPLSCNSSMLVFFGTSVIPFFLDLSMKPKGLGHQPSKVPFSSPMMLIFGGKGYEHVKVRVRDMAPGKPLTDVDQAFED